MTVIDEKTVVPESTVEYEALKHILASRGAVALEDELSGQRLEVPASLRRALELLTEAFGRGERVTLVEATQMLTTQEAADLLGVSRPTVIKYLDSGVLPYDMRGTHRRIPLSGVLEYQRERRIRAQALTEMVRDADDYRPDVDHFVRTR